MLENVPPYNLRLRREGEDHSLERFLIVELASEVRLELIGGFSSIFLWLLLFPVMRFLQQTMVF